MEHKNREDGNISTLTEKGWNNSRALDSSGLSAGGKLDGMRNM